MKREDNPLVRIYTVWTQNTKLHYDIFFIFSQNNHKRTRYDVRDK